MVLVIAGVWAARTKNTNTAKTMSWIAVVAGVWLIIGTLILPRPVMAIGAWNDIIIGVTVIVLGAWAALTSRE
jgi:hypothetical protein